MASGEFRGLCFTACLAGHRKHMRRQMLEKAFTPLKSLEKAVSCIQTGA
jgi:hypothetical protein